MAVSHLFQDEDSIQVVTPDVQAVLDKEMTKLMEAESKFQSLSPADKFKADTWFANYHTFEDIRAWYKDLTEKYPDLITFIPSIGKTYEGNDIFAIKVTSGKDRFTKPQIWYHSGDHAREWIGPATVQYFIHQLVTGYGADKTSTSILDRVELIVVPLMNVDGYKYTWKGQRLWRKNRKPNKGDFFGSIGVDLNRNWPSHWGEGGSSSLPYSDVYMGPSPASENEVQALMKFFMNANHTRLVAGIDFHAFSQLILRPYGESCTYPLNLLALLKKAGDGMAAVIREQSGKKYISEKTIELYKATGAASDWFYDEDVFKWLPDRRLYAYTIELRPAADETWGNDGFILPPEQIVPTGKEIFEALKFYTDFVLANPIVVA
ncbi:carboxypeptidase A1-like protein [Zopfochytrium polystomum]|nr:carboxypeptidase A1-like protein [Zopfochytrium polystomum]